NRYHPDTAAHQGHSRSSLSQVVPVPRFRAARVIGMQACRTVSGSENCCRLTSISGAILR
ncbi:hypothetical protein, partial [Ruminococcus callidus]|uniref:hypothetical protein n=1 Tax=Ruminococcus callidus TaxID=40519 RepID=UPI0023F91998